MNRFVNKVALITGGASGIGAAVSARLAREGAAVALVDINKEKLELHAKKLTSQGFQGHWFDKYKNST